jgi:uncharacterized membrane protein
MDAKKKNKKFNPITRIYNATGNVLTADEKTYAAEVYQTTGQEALKRETVDQWTAKQAAAATTFRQYLDQLYPVAKRAAFKAKVEAEAPLIIQQDTQAAATASAERANYDARVAEANKPWYLKTKTLVWAGIIAVVGTIGTIVLVKKFGK